MDRLFNEVMIAKAFCRQTMIYEKMQVAKKYEQFSHFKEKNSPLPYLVQIIEYIFSLLGTIAPVERVFTLIKIYGLKKEVEWLNQQLKFLR